MARILLVEDDDVLREMTCTVLQLENHEVVTARDGLEALTLFQQTSPEMVVSDIGMPFMDGYGLLDAVRKLPEGAAVPFLFLSAYSERKDIRQARELGADDYLSKPFEMRELLEAVRTRLARRRAALLFDTREAHLQTITLLANLIEARDAYTRGHVERVQQLALRLGRALNWSAEDLSALEYGALLHDVGKITTPEAILNKPGDLTAEEIKIMREHTTAGAAILRGVSHLERAVPFALHHHERWDGGGYPEGLAAEKIPREGRLMAIVDVFDALTTDRSYHQGKSVASVLEMLQREAGAYFDPQMVGVFISLFQAD
ncbi:MAG: response regulator [Anaerolineales bacterium]